MLISYRNLILFSIFTITGVAHGNEDYLVTEAIDHKQSTGMLAFEFVTKNYRQERLIGPLLEYVFGIDPLRKCIERVNFSKKENDPTPEEIERDGQPCCHEEQFPSYEQKPFERSKSVILTSPTQEGEAFLSLLALTDRRRYQEVMQEKINQKAYEDRIIRESIDRIIREEQKKSLACTRRARGSVKNYLQYNLRTSTLSGRLT